MMNRELMTSCSDRCNTRDAANTEPYLAEDVVPSFHSEPREQRSRRCHQLEAKTAMHGRRHRGGTKG
jgi:hypothetical protein